MRFHQAAPAIAVAVLALGAAAVLLAAPAPAASASTPPPGSAAMSPTQVALTASYSIVGGGGSSASDLLSYYSNGVLQNVPLTGTPTVYMVDSGTQWSAQSILTGSTSRERWITGQDVGGAISAPLTVSFSYQHQYLARFAYNVTRGEAGVTPPSVTFNELGNPVSLLLPQSFIPQSSWVDAASPYSFPSLLPSSSATERWISQTPTSGTITKAETVTVSYNHEFLVTASYSIIGGGSPPAPTFSSALLGASSTMTMSTVPKSAWFDAGAASSFSPTLAGTSTERWIGTVIVATPSGPALSTDNNVTVNSALTITPVYYHQLLVNLSFTFAGGNASGLTPPAFTYQYFGGKTNATGDVSVWVDGGTSFTIPETLCCTSSPSMERWTLYNSTTGTINSATRISPTYYHQVTQSFAYSVVGQNPPSPSEGPSVTYMAGGQAQKLTLLLTPQSVWADASSPFTAATALPASTTSERWFAENGTGVTSGSVPAAPIVIPYTQQYLITLIGGASPTQWADAGGSTFSTLDVFGRDGGTGSRAVTYQVDSGATIQVTKPQLYLAIPMTVDGPHTVRFTSVTQFQVSLDPGASGAVVSITPPTVPGDKYWYDTETSVKVVLNATWGRAGGVGERITSISATARPTIYVNGIQAVQAYNTTAIQSPVSITTTSTTQYEVVLDGPALAAFSSISPNSTFSGERFWYDAGSPAVTVTLNGVYARSGGTGTRLTSWQLNSGPITKVATSGTFTIVTGALSSPQFVNATAVTQYEVTIDGGGSAALSSMTSPPIPGDAGWYDASGSVGVIMNGVWGRSAGTGQRLASFSINGGPPHLVASSGLVTVLNETSLGSSESISTSVVTQYQVSLDSGASSALASITSTQVPNDKYWFDSGTPVAVSLDGFWGRTSTTGSRLLSYSVDKGESTPVLSSAPVQVLSLDAISGPHSVAAKSAVQYHLSSSAPGWTSVTSPTLPGDVPGWFDSGTAVHAVYKDAWNQTSTGTRSSVVSYSVDGGRKDSVSRSGAGNFTVSVAMNSAHTIVLTSVTQYLFAVSPSQVAASANPPSPTNDSYFDSGSKVTFTIPRYWNASSGPGARESLASYSLDGGVQVAATGSATGATVTLPSLTFVQPHELFLNASLQHEVRFTFLDASGSKVISPSGVALGVENHIVSIQGTSAWIDDGTSFSVAGVTWEGADVGPTPAPSYQMADSPLNVTLRARVYDASLKVVDLFGLPLSGAQVSMTLANGTIVKGATNSAGTFTAPSVPLGTFGATISSLGSSSHITGDAASGQPVAQGRVLFSLVSLFVIVAVIAGGLTSAVIFIRLRKRKAAPEPA